MNESDWLADTYVHNIAGFASTGRSAVCLDLALFCFALLSSSHAHLVESQINCFACW